MKKPCKVLHILLETFDVTFNANRIYFSFCKIYNNDKYINKFVDIRFMALNYVLMLNITRSQIDLELYCTMIKFGSSF